VLLLAISKVAQE